MDRYYIEIDYNFHGHAEGIEIDPEGDWVKHDDAVLEIGARDLRIAELEAQLLQANKEIQSIGESVDTF